MRRRAVTATGVRVLDDLPVHTARLTLRRLTAADRDAVAALFADPEVTTFFHRPMSSADAEGWLRRNTRRYRQDGTGLFAVCSSEWLGTCGIIARRIDDTPAFELAYHFRREVWGCGYASEAARACIDLVFRTQPADVVPSLDALIRPGNHRSHRLVRRLGFALGGAVVHGGFDHERWTLTRAQHEARAVEQPIHEAVPPGRAVGPSASFPTRRA